MSQMALIANSQWQYDINKTFRQKRHIKGLWTILHDKLIISQRSMIWSIWMPEVECCYNPLENFRWKAFHFESWKRENVQKLSMPPWLQKERMEQKTLSLKKWVHWTQSKCNLKHKVKVARSEDLNQKKIPKKRTKRKTICNCVWRGLLVLS